MANCQASSLEDALSQTAQYPRNITWPNVMENTLRALEYQLERRSSKLFCPEPDTLSATTRAAVDIFELYREPEGPKLRRIYNAPMLRDHLCVPLTGHRPDPWQRMIFVNALSSRDPLNITRAMLLEVLTYHTVMPTFLEYIFPFGEQHYPRDFHLMGFRSESRWGDGACGFKDTDLGRSGQHVELCYSVKSVEKTSDESSHPADDWSIRQCSVHHYFDIKTQRETWIVVKANKVISNALQNHANETHRINRSGTSNRISAFSSALAKHEIISAWADENWNWYIADLESYLQDKTNLALSASWELPQSPTSAPLTPSKELFEPSHTKPRSFSWRTIHKRTLSGSTWKSDKPTLNSHPTTRTSEGTIGIRQASGFDNFSFRDLQNVQFVEDKAIEALLVLQANSRVLRDLQAEYQKLCSDQNAMTHVGNDWKTAIASFNNRIDAIKQNLDMQISRVGSLLQLVAGRKSLLNGALQYRSMEASKRYADRSQVSAERMEEMTKEMHVIAQKTKAETVSMRIITWVTLFFLPGTFISTLMSTPIVHFEHTTDGFSMSNIGFGALKLYLAISLPLVLLTLLAWWAFRLWDKRTERKEKEKEEEEEEKFRL